MAENAAHFKVTFDLTERDVIQFMRYHTMHPPGGRRWLWTLYATWIIAATILVLSLDYGLPPDHPLFHTMRWIAAAVTIPVCALGGLVWYWIMRAFQWVVMPFYARSWARHTIGVVGEWTVEASSEGVAWTGRTAEAALKWSGIQRIVRTPDHVLLYQGRSYAQIIPQRAFASPAAADEFFRAVRDWHAAATEPASAEPRAPSG